MWFSPMNPIENVLIFLSRSYVHILFQYPIDYFALSVNYYTQNTLTLVGIHKTIWKTTHWVFIFSFVQNFMFMISTIRMCHKMWIKLPIKRFWDRIFHPWTWRSFYTRQFWVMILFRIIHNIELQLPKLNRLWCLKWCIT